MNRRYAIIGATGGIGAELCRTLSRAGARLYLGARGEDRLKALLGEIGGVAEAATLDATRSADVDKFISDAAAALGGLDGVVCLTGSILLKPAHLTTDAEFAETLAVNLNAAFHTLRAGVKAMEAGGSIVLASTAASRIGLANHEAIAAAKGAINGLVLAAAATYAPKGIRVNAVAPGLVRTPLSARLTGNELALKASTAMHALGRIGEPADVAGAIAWLLDPASSWVTGQILGVDGGLGSVRSK